MKTGGQQWISRTALNDEARLLARMAISAQMTTGQSMLQEFRARYGIARFEEQRGWQLSDEQRRAVEAIVEGTAPIDADLRRRRLGQDQRPGRRASRDARLQGPAGHVDGDAGGVEGRARSAPNGAASPPPYP